MKFAGSALLAGVLGGGFVIAYAVVAHYTSATPGVGLWAIVLAGASLALVGYGFARDSRLGMAAWLLLLVAFAAFAWHLPDMANPVATLYFVQHVGLNAAFGLLFGRTLRAGREPLITSLARLIHTTMTPALQRYTRQVTLAWTLFFTVMGLLSVLLFFLAPIEAWSLFANILTMPLVIAMFVAEYAVRRQVLPPEDRVGLLASVRAFRAAMRP